MICPICNSTAPDESTHCPSCGAALTGPDDVSPAHDPACDSVSEFIFCEGCGARLSAEDRTCPKCGRPAPGILSQNSAALDLAAGKTASFPRLTSDMIAGAVPAPEAASDAGPVLSAFDEGATSVIDSDEVRAAVDAAPRSGSSRSGSRRPLPQQGEDASDGADPYAKPRRGRWIALAACVALVAGGAWFIGADPLGVMPGFYASFESAASDMFPSRQVPEDDADVEDAPADAEDAEDDESADSAQVNDSTLSEAEAYQRLSAIYGRIVELQDQIGPVVETYNGQYLVKDASQRREASRGAYDLRDSLTGVLDDIDALVLSDDTAYAQDVEHMRQLATWTYNRVDVLCRSWDINLALGEDERPADHQDEILAPLREVEKVDGKAVDVVQYEQNVSAWKPVEK